ncbi:hypothetical protein ABBQ38_011047 [Trebouxia sp. C0009 RCD-2024]
MPYGGVPLSVAAGGRESRHAHTRDGDAIESISKEVFTSGLLVSICSYQGCLYDIVFKLCMHRSARPRQSRCPALATHQWRLVWPCICYVGSAAMGAIMRICDSLCVRLPTRSSPQKCLCARQLNDVIPMVEMVHSGPRSTLAQALHLHQVVAWTFPLAYFSCKDDVGVCCFKTTHHFANWYVRESVEGLQIPCCQA